MKNNIIYYYNLQINNLYQNNNIYYFEINSEHYELRQYTRDIKQQKEIYELNKKMIFYNIPVYKIIANKDNNIVTIINNIAYILLKINIKRKKEITLYNLTPFINYNFDNYNSLKRESWDILWGKKIDYLEYQINQTGKKHPLLVESFSYFVGLAENAISYAKNTTLETKKENVDKETLSHIKISKDIDYIYNPLNIILDHSSRTIAEYIKLSFFTNNQNIYNELNNFFSNYYFSEYGIRMLYARILYPSFYFDMYEEIILNKRKESDILNITSKTNEYENYIENIYLFLKKFYNIPEVEWLKKK